MSSVTLREKTPIILLYANDEYFGYGPMPDAHKVSANDIHDYVSKTGTLPMLREKDDVIHSISDKWQSWNDRNDAHNVKMQLQAQDRESPLMPYAIPIINPKPYKMNGNSIYVMPMVTPLIAMRMCANDSDIFDTTKEKNSSVLQMGLLAPSNCSIYIKSLTFNAVYLFDQFKTYDFLLNDTKIVGFAFSTGNIISGPL